MTISSLRFQDIGKFSTMMFNLVRKHQWTFTASCLSGVFFVQDVLDFPFHSLLQCVLS